MYGNEKLNKSNILRYGLTIEFVKQFSSLKYSGIELPLTLIRHFHVFIKPYVNKYLSNRIYIRKLQLKHRIYTMKDVQGVLYRKPKMVRNLAKYPQRKTILMSGVFARFALKQFRKSNVILMNANHHDKKAINVYNYPQNFSIYNFLVTQRRVKLSKKKLNNYKNQLQKLFTKNLKHEIFGTKNFRNWLRRNLIRSIKMIHALEVLIRKQPIGLILDHVEITTPGNILALLALKYNLPFINAPQVLITDRSIIPTRASYYFVWGNNYKNWLNKRGIPLKKVKITGNLRFEYANPGRFISKQNIVKQLNIPNNNLIVTYTTQTFSNSINLTIINWIIKSISNLPVTFIIKPHPADPFDYTRYLQPPKIILAPSNLHLYDILVNTDFLMTISSNTAIEAAVLKKGILALQPRIPYHYEVNNNDFNSFLVKSEAGVAIYNFRDLRNTVERLIVNKKYKEEIINKGQNFLKHTIRLNISPSVIMRRLIQNIIRK